MSKMTVPAGYYPTKTPGIIATKDEWGNEIRMFADSNIQGQVDKAIKNANLGPDDHGRVVTYMDKESIKLGVVVRPFKNGKWAKRFSVVGTLTHDWDAPMGDWEPSVAASLKF